MGLVKLKLTEKFKYLKKGLRKLNRLQSKNDDYICSRRKLTTNLAGSKYQ